MGFPSNTNADLFSDWILPFALVCAGLMLVYALVERGRRARGNRPWQSTPQPEKPKLLEADTVGGQVQCPACSSFATEERDRSFEKRVCGNCGHRFALKD